MKRLGRNHSVTLRAKTTLAAVRGDRTLAKLAGPLGVQPHQIDQWRAELPERAAEAFAAAGEKCDAGLDVARQDWAGDAAE